MFVLRSSISVKVSTKIFGIIKQWGWEGEGGGDQISIGGWEKILKSTSRENFYFTLKSNRGRTFILR